MCKPNEDKKKKREELCKVLAIKNRKNWTTGNCKFCYYHSPLFPLSLWFFLSAHKDNELDFKSVFLKKNNKKTNHIIRLTLCLFQANKSGLVLLKPLTYLEWVSKILWTIIEKQYLRYIFKFIHIFWNLIVCALYLHK